LETWSHEAEAARNQHQDHYHEITAPGTASPATTQGVEMQLPTARQRAAGHMGRPRSPLHAETRHTAMLLGGAIGLMGIFALLLFFGTTRLAG
jgi:hypothetical protein